ncbi:MAG: polysaccharide deacetylase family protein [Selenomonadaceae bacterium]|nr:polysaccharide deacetylase family protein [Selenomonadaceae bacterium]
MEGSEVYNVTPEEFAAQLDYLQQNGYTTITLREFMQAKHGKITLPEKPIILTFDDGYDNNYTEMLPILEAHDMKAVVYVITNELGKEGYLTLDQVKDMQGRGVEIGSHTADHIPLVMLDENILLNQVRYSKIFLEWSGLETIYTFSYPNGEYNLDLTKLLQQEGYLTAVTGDVGLNTLDSNPYTLKRVHIRKPRFGITEFKWRLLKAELAEKIKSIFNF